MAPALLEVENLRVELTTRAGVAPVIDDLSFHHRTRAKHSALSANRGCGKSMTALAIMGLLPEKDRPHRFGSDPFRRRRSDHRLRRKRCATCAATRSR